ncbi:MAG: hypothetical protein E7590_10185 [Ruminococcaceae bacterium]|nr:hypothetical protein [Oscillospiraceae bacterium]MBE6703025.1 hypothetical protein [Oscillospiraceae bacterium]
MTIFASDPRFLGASDSETIQNAVDHAEKSHAETLVIPRENPRTGAPLWVIERSILLPSDLCIMLEGAHLRLADGVIENIFRNKNAWTPLGNTAEGEQSGIRIIGMGQALLDGGKPNGMCEQLLRDNPGKYPSMLRNVPVFLHNVRDFEVRGIRFADARYWALTLMYCRHGRASELDFRMYGTLENQDGIDLRIGCEHIAVENITGITGDDTVALTALPLESDQATAGLVVKGKSVDIHDVTIRNVTSATHGNHLLRFLNENGAKIYNVTVTDVRDTGEAISGATILCGTTDPYLMTHPHKMGEFRNITIQNVISRAQRALDLCEPCEDLLIENVAAEQGTEMGIRLKENFVAKNVTIRNLVLSPTEPADCLVDTFCSTEAVADLHFENIRAENVRYLYRGTPLQIGELQATAPLCKTATSAHAQLASAYGRYFYTAYGKVIQNRPKDSRFS